MVKKTKACPPPACPEKIRIGTIANGGGAANFIRQTLPHGFESYSVMFWATLGGAKLPELAKQCRQVLSNSGAVVSSLGMFGNPLTGDKDAKEVIDGFHKCIDAAVAFGCDLVTGFAGRLPDTPISDCMAAFKKVWSPLAKHASDAGVRIAFENCDMGGDWQRSSWNIAQNPTAWEMMFAQFTSEHVGLQWEPCHQMVSLIDPIPQLAKWVKKVFHVHGKDATVRWDIVREHGVHGPHQFAWHRSPGFGDSNWTNIITILRMAGFVGSIDIEGYHDPVYRDALEMTGQVHALNYLKGCRGGSFVPNPT